MDAATASSAPLILVNLLFAGIALGVGFVAGAWFLGGKASADTDESEADGDAALEKHLAVERAMLASSRLKDLATGVATDVGAHSTQVEQINADLAALKDAGAEAQTAGVATALAQIVEANSQLQSRLAKAEEQIHAQAEEIRAHESEARTDSLTNLSNRRAFDDQLAQRYAEWQRKATPFSLIILDVDHFKKFNDTHGHQAGDEVLRQVAKSLHDIVRDMDIACRYGGEEFAIILPATNGRDVLGLVERLRKGIEKLSIAFEGKTLNVTASFGLAQIVQGEDQKNLLKRADDALYAAKDAGRNCGRFHDGEHCIPVAGDGPATKSKRRVATSDETVPTKLLDKLPNRTRFTEELRRRISEANRSGEPLSVISVEFSPFEKLRDEYGEPVALLTLDSLAQFLASTLRDMDLLGRLDEGEFCIMTPKAAQADAELVADRAAAALAKCSVPIGDEQLPLSTVMGVAELRTEDSAASLISRASDAMLSNRIESLSTV